MNITTGRVILRTPIATVSTVGNLSRTTDEPIRIYEDAPPKYSPPPSYTTATGARIAKMLRQSIRRSVRRYDTKYSQMFSLNLLYMIPFFCFVIG